mmetsp:Transcript_7168/g.10464  ORF Transcript_7168/g.10464 Transcript_7168/m.10464 type:complete len:358 (-) Transcript_7168:40-1113(-)
MITINNLRIVKILALLLATTSSLYTHNGLTTRNAKKRRLAVLFEKQQLYDYEGGDSVQSRRGFLSTTVGVTTALLLIYQQAPALAEEGGPICIIGANGKTGSECVGACLARGIQVVATSRGGEYTQGGPYDADISKKLLQRKPCDVTIPSTVDSAILKSRAVIFAASASKAGGTASAVDNVGLVNVAKACINQKIPHLVIVSSGAVTKPDSPVYKFLNLFGNIMAEKIKGEDAVRELYKNQASGCTYTVIRPGGLTIEEGRGVGALELNQGDTKSGRISRADVASICVESTNYPQLTGGATFECYDADTAKPLKTVGVSNILKQKTKADDDQVFINGKERRGSTFREIFTGLEKDFS